MNNRIIELAKKSLLTEWFWLDPNLSSIDYLSEKEAIENFAEMIIRECAEVALREDHDPYECILSHFGLKPECRCGKDHTGQEPVNEGELVKQFAKEISDEIDAQVLNKLEKRLNETLE